MLFSKRETSFERFQIEQIGMVSKVEAEPLLRRVASLLLKRNQASCFEQTSLGSETRRRRRRESIKGARLYLFITSGKQTKSRQHYAQVSTSLMVLDVVPKW